MQDVYKNYKILLREIKEDITMENTTEGSVLLRCKLFPNSNRFIYLFQIHRFITITVKIQAGFMVKIDTLSYV